MTQSQEIRDQLLRIYNGDADQSADRTLEEVTSYFSQAIKQAEIRGEIKGLKRSKRHLDGKYGKPIVISGDAQVVVSKAMAGFIDVSNRISALARKLKDGSHVE